MVFVWVRAALRWSGLFFRSIRIFFAEWLKVERVAPVLRVERREDTAHGMFHVKHWFLSRGRHLGRPSQLTARSRFGCLLRHRWSAVDCLPCFGVVGFNIYLWLGRLGTPLG